MKECEESEIWILGFISEQCETNHHTFQWFLLNYRNEELNKESHYDS